MDGHSGRAWLVAGVAAVLALAGAIVVGWTPAAPAVLDCARFAADVAAQLAALCG